MNIKEFIDGCLLKKYKLTKPGIYFIFCIPTQKIYIGSASRIADRLWHHRKNLKENCHDNSYLQHAWDKYGPSNFNFGVVENLEDKTQLCIREQYWMDILKAYDRDIGFNICKIASSSLGYKHTNECKERMSNLKKGISLSKEHRTKISKSLIGKNIGSKCGGASIDESLATSIKLEICEQKRSLAEIARLFKVSYGVVIGIAIGRNWKHVASFLTLPRLDNGRDPNHHG